MNGDARIRAAAREAGTKIKDDGAGDRKIRRAAAAAGVKPDDGSGDRRILQCGAAAAARDAEWRGRRAAGLSDGDEGDVMAKALADLDAAVAAIGRPTVKKRRPSMPTTSKRLAQRTTASAPPVSRQAGPPPVTVRPKSTSAPAPPPPNPLIPAPSALLRGTVPIASPALPISSESHLGFWNFRDRIAGDIRTKRVPPTPEAIVGHATAKYGVGVADAAEWTERFLASLSRDVERRTRP